MESVLTESGKALCLSLGLINPSYKECSAALLQNSLSCDRNFVCPIDNVSTPNDKDHYKDNSNCTSVATYDIFDGSKGTQYYCFNPAKLVRVPNTAIWYWVKEQK